MKAVPALTNTNPEPAGPHIL